MARKKITPATTVEQRLARPRETPDQRNARRIAAAEEMAAKAETMRLRASVDILAVRAAKAGIAPRRVAAIRSMATLASVLCRNDGQESENITLSDWIHRVEVVVGDAESIIHAEFDDEEPAA